MFTEQDNNIVWNLDKNGVLHLHVDTKQDIGLSGSKKNLLIASSRGNQSLVLDDGRSISIGINIYTKP